MKSLKLGFIGSGFIAQFMAKAMFQVRDVELAAIYDRSGAEELAAFAGDSGRNYATVSKKFAITQMPWPSFPQTLRA